MSVNAWFNIFVMCQKKWFPQQKNRQKRQFRKQIGYGGPSRVKYREII